MTAKRATAKAGTKGATKKAPNPKRPVATRERQLPPGVCNARQERFAQEFLLDLRASRAYQTVYGCSDRVAQVNGFKTLAIPHVADRIAALMAERSRRTGIDADTVLGELLRLARVDIGQAFAEDGSLLPIRDIPEDVRRAISAVETDELFEGTGKEKVQIGITRKLKFWDKTKALELLGKHLKLWVDRVEHDASDSLAKLIADAYQPKGGA